MNSNHYAVIMAGGIGSRFWPLSRTAYPKQFLDILNTGRTLLQATYDRFSTFIPRENIFIVTSDEYISIVQEQLPQMDAAGIVGEPERKNTAPCIALIALKLKKMNPAANLIVAPSDHLIEDEAAFRENCLQGLAATKNHNVFVTLGITPASAHTGYGYIEYDRTGEQKHIFPVKRFAEKPGKETALAFLQQGGYLWNSGIFIWKACDIVSAFNRYIPEMYRIFEEAFPALNTTDETAAVKQVYRQCASVSIDYAILEKATNVYVIPAEFGWSDLGSWNSAWENFEKDGVHNAVSGSNTIMVDASGCMVHSADNRLVLIGGVDDLIIVNTPDALLVCKKENEQQLKEYLARVKEAKGELYL